MTPILCIIDTLLPDRGVDIIHHYVIVTPPVTLVIRCRWYHGYILVSRAVLTLWAQKMSSYIEGGMDGWMSKGGKEEQRVGGRKGGWVVPWVGGQAGRKRES